MSSVAPYTSNVQYARELFFEEGTVPSGLVNEAVLRSWQRCIEEGRTATERMAFNAVERHAVSNLLERNRQLLAAAEPVMKQLADAVAGIGYGVLLTDASGLALAVHGPVDSGGQLMRKALRPGVDLSERTIGTNAMFTAMEECRPIGINGAEHFFSQNHVFQCAAAPILDPGGRVIGSIDLSRDSPGPHCGALPLIAACASTIEAALFLQVPAAFVVLLDWTQDVSGSPSAALLSFGPDGDVIAINSACRSLIGLSPALPIRHYDDLFCGRFGDFVAALRTARAPVPLRLHFGLGLYARPLGDTATQAHKKSIVPSRMAGRIAPELPAELPEFGDDRIPARFANAQRALSVDLPVLITGETGTGKEVAARVLHDGSRHRQGPFVAINCAAIPRELIEGELFGHADGAFTGARRGGAKGKIEQADRGTLFLDEIGDMPLELQTRLLRVLETREVTRLGDGVSCKVDLQLICATHQNLEQLIETGRFREDLYYRVNGLALELPALRSRNSIADLLTKVSEEEGIPPQRLSSEARDILLAYQWPGNVRELRHALRHAKAMCEDEEAITLAHFPERIRRASKELVSRPDTVPVREDALLKDLATRTTEEVLRNFGGNITLAAQHLGISRSTLHRWLKKRQ